MAQRWYYARGGQKIGPVTSQELRYLAASGALQPTDLVWVEGNDRGKEARSVVGLFTPVAAESPSTDPRRAGRTAGTDGVVDPALDLDRLRSRLTRHAGAIPHHQIDHLGSAIEVRAARRILVYRIAWRTLFEGRQVVERQAPHDGSRAIPPPKYRRQGLDPWTIPLPPPIDFADRTSELPVEGSESVHGCGGCGSVGHVTCDNCQG